MNKFGRVLLPFVTPFYENGDVNYDAFKELINYTINKGFVDTIIVTGTTGEFNTLSFDERVKLFETALIVSAGKLPVIAGVGCASTRETIALIKEAEKLGIDTCMVVVPYYCKATQEGLYQHYMSLIENTKIDILLYNIPLFTGINLEPATVARLVKESKRFIGIKDEAGVNPVQLTSYYYAVKDQNPDFLLFNGDDLMLMPTLTQGAAGIVSGGSHLMGDKFKLCFEKYFEGDNEKAMEIARELYKLPTAFGSTGRIHPNPMLRAAIEIVTGIKIGAPRLPLDEISEEERAILINALKDLKLI